MLLPKLTDPRPMVRTITCWTLSRYTERLFPRPNPDARPPANPSPEQQQVFDAVLVGVLERVLDRNKFVQEAACSALAEMVEQTQLVRGQVLLPRLKVGLWVGRGGGHP
jgi:transportin-1